MSFAPATDIFSSARSRPVLESLGDLARSFVNAINPIPSISILTDPVIRAIFNYLRMGLELDLEVETYLERHPDRLLMILRIHQIIPSQVDGRYKLTLEHYPDSAPTLVYTIYCSKDLNRLELLEGLTDVILKEIPEETFHQFGLDLALER